jgi:hypothetical protein
MTMLLLMMVVVWSVRSLMVINLMIVTTMTTIKRTSAGVAVVAKLPLPLDSYLWAPQPEDSHRILIRGSSRQKVRPEATKITIMVCPRHRRMYCLRCTCIGDSTQAHHDANCYI